MLFKIDRLMKSDNVQFRKIGWELYHSDWEQGWNKEKVEEIMNNIIDCLEKVYEQGFKDSEENILEQ